MLQQQVCPYQTERGASVPFSSSEDGSPNRLPLKIVVSSGEGGEPASEGDAEDKRQRKRRRGSEVVVNEILNEKTDRTEIRLEGGKPEEKDLRRNDRRFQTSDLIEAEALRPQSARVSRSPCDACRKCQDRCVNVNCKICRIKLSHFRRKFVSANEQQMPPSFNLLPAFVQNLGASLIPSPQPAKELPVFSICEAKRHCDTRSLWVVAHGKVFDATSIILAHPGGSQCLFRRVGVDCSDDFDYHSAKAKSLIWAKLHVGFCTPCVGTPSYIPKNQPPDSMASSCSLM